MDGQSYLLLIRDEGGPPELQVMLLPGVRAHLCARSPFSSLLVGTGRRWCVQGEGSTWVHLPCVGVCQVQLQALILLGFP